MFVWSCFLCYLLTISVQVHTWDGDFRVEVQLQRFENRDGIISNGKYCDIFTKCDPLLYGFMDLIKPLSSYPGAATNPRDFQLIASEEGKNFLDLNNILASNMCGRIDLPTSATLRVEAYDHDVLTNNDLMEQFDCQFPFNPNGDNVLSWSAIVSCRAIHQPGRIKLTFRWRIFPIPDRCGAADKPPATKVRTTTIRTKVLTTTAPPVRSTTVPKTSTKVSRTSTTTDSHILTNDIQPDFIDEDYANAYSVYPDGVN